MDSLSGRALSAFPRLSLGLRLFPQKSCSRVSGQLARAGMGKLEAQGYLSGAAVSCAAAAAILTAASLLILAPEEALALFLLSFGFSFSFLYFLPSLLAKRRAALAESELPFLLREAAVYLDIGLPFEKGIARLAQRNYSLSPDFQRAFLEIKSGATVPAALLAVAGRSGSLQVKRGLMLLSSLYETGSGSEPLKRAAEDMASSQLSAMRLQSGRLSLLSLLFICCSALLPSFFTVLAAVWPSVSPSPLEPWQLWLSFILLFPLLNAAALLIILLLMPPLSQHASSGRGMLSSFLLESGFRHGTRAFALILAASSLVLSAASFAAGSLPLAALCLCIAPAAYAVASYLASRKIEEAESHLPDALYSAASTHKLLSAEKMLLFLSKGGFGSLSAAFELALRRQKAGDSFSSSMAAAALQCPSPLVQRAFSLLVVSYETGANMYSSLREAAQDVSSFFSLVRERSSQLAVQRYTILAASSLLVPLILGTVVSLSPMLSSVSFAGAPAGPGIAATLALACPAYLAINCLLSSLLLSLSETNPGRAALYFAFTAPVSQLVFAMASSGSLLAG